MAFQLQSYSWIIKVSLLPVFLVIALIVILLVYGSCVIPNFCIKRYSLTNGTPTLQPSEQLSDPNPSAQCWRKFEGLCVPNEGRCPFNQYNNIKTNKCAEDYKCCKPQPPVVGNLPERRSCGSAPAPPERFRVSNGWVTVAWPWIVSIRRHSRHICGGTIISPSVVLSAAHCFVTPKDASAYSVVTGEFNIQRKDGTEVIYNILQVTWTNFNSITGWNDIVILTLDGKIQMDFHRQPACLPVPEDNFRFLNSTGNSDTDVCLILGWGGSLTLNTPYLQMAALPLIDPHRCKSMTSRMMYNMQVFDSRYNICTYFDSDYMITDTCPGDSGGPLFCKRKDKIILAGIISWGAPLCAGFDQPGIYVNVLHYVPWIKGIVRDLPK